MPKEAGRNDGAQPDAAPESAPRYGGALQTLSAVVRGATLVGKFLLIFVLAKFLPPEDVAIYGLMAATIAYALLVVGLDFYAFSNRELVANSRERWRSMLRDQGVFYGLAYLAALPLGILLFSQGVLPWSVAWWFFALLAGEHIAQEIHRLLVAIGEPLWSSFVLFLRAGVWAYVVAIWMAVSPSARSLDSVFGAWLVGALCAIALALWPLRRTVSARLSAGVNWEWIRQGVRVALPFAVATLCLRATSTADRYLIDWINGVDVLAAYVVYVGIANAIMSLLDAGVFSFQYPRLLAAANRADRTVFTHELRRLWVHTVVATVLLGAAAYVLAYPVLNWIGRPIYTAHLDLLPLVLLAAGLTAVSMVPHYSLYARKKDGAIIAAHISSPIVFALAIWFGDPSLEKFVVPAAVVASAAYIFFLKLMADVQQ